MTQKIKAKPDVVEVNALDVLKTIRKGRLVHEMAEKIQELTTAVREHGKKGDLVLKLTISPIGKTDADGIGSINVTLEDSLRINKPEARKGATIFFASRKGTLTRNNPDQTEMEM